MPPLFSAMAQLKPTSKYRFFVDTPLSVVNNVQWALECAQMSFGMTGGEGGDGTGRDGTGRDGTGRDGTGRDGTGRDGTGRDGTGRDGTGRDGTGRDGTGDCTLQEKCLWFWRQFLSSEDLL